MPGPFVSDPMYKIAANLETISESLERLEERFCGNQCDEIEYEYPETCRGCIFCYDCQECRHPSDEKRFRFREARVSSISEGEHFDPYEKALCYGFVKILDIDKTRS